MLHTRQINSALSIGILDLDQFSSANKITHKRDLEKAGALYLASFLLNRRVTELHYDAHNKPHLKNASEHISISHSHGRLAVAVNKSQPTGIDIELVRAKVIHIREKFLCSEELAWAGDNTERLITLWCAKEALYKLYGQRQVTFSEHIRITSEDGVLTGSLSVPGYSRRFELIREIHGQHILVFVKHEI